MEENNNRGKAIIATLCVLAFTFGIWLWTKINTASKLTYKILSPESIKVDFSALKLTWSQPVQITNPTNTGILLRLIQFDVLLKGGVLGSGFLNQTVVIKSLEQTVLKVPCSVSILDLVSLIPDLISQITKRSIKFDLKGNINAEGFTISVESSATIEIPDLKFLK
ncbi:NDR1/HIN1-like protein [Flectobacillus longus]|uniref:NDR1/HIN1-like protein n=1 Tax=Flectobacillus longus TaxID=2984207 RepID=UPI0024B85F68|nr:LEA type 2 family protein [Flectobacillus longus]MDI9878917.1 LEA type 2 family protein [Flectobacillus longus]